VDHDDDSARAWVQVLITIDSLLPFGPVLVATAFRDRGALDRQPARPMTRRHGAGERERIGDDWFAPNRRTACPAD
jgi:hypothetical protein